MVVDLCACVCGWVGEVYGIGTKIADIWVSLLDLVGGYGIECVGSTGFRCVFDGGMCVYLGGMILCVWLRDKRIADV